MEEACKAATDGEVLYHEAGAHERAAREKEEAPKLQRLPLSHVELKQDPIPDREWQKQVKSQLAQLEKTKPSAVVCIDTATAGGYPFVSGDTDVPIEFARKGNIDGDTPLWLAVKVRISDTAMLTLG